MFEHILLGIIQGIAEWLPVSSEGILILIQTHIFIHEDAQLMDNVRLALFLHFGTFLAALIYFRHEIPMLLKTLFQYNTQPSRYQKLIVFLSLSTLISGTLGLLLLKGLANATAHLEGATHLITGLIGCLLIGTGFLELNAAQNHGKRQIDHLTLKDGFLLGLTQACAALPGFSRSGLTVSALLLLKFDKACALRLSFLMSLPIVLAGNILLNADKFQFSFEALSGLAGAFIFGLATIHLLLNVAQKINFGFFMCGFGALTVLSAFLH